MFESVDLLYYSLHKISLNNGGSYIDSPGWIKNKKATINHKIKIMNVLNMKIRKTLKEHQKLSLLLINITGRI